MTHRSSALVGITAIVLLAGGCGGGEQDGEIVVFAASSLSDAVEEIVAGFEADGEAGVELVIGGSASLAAQIRDGAPADLFLSADRHWADEVAAVCSPPCRVRPFATNTLVLAVPSGNPAGVTGLEDLTRPELRVVLCAREVPCGGLSEAVTSAHGLTAEPDSYEPSVRAVRTLLTLGEADVGLVYATDVTDAIEVVPDDRLSQHATAYFEVILDPDDSDAITLADVISGPTGREVLRRLGFGPVSS